MTNIPNISQSCNNKLEYQADKNKTTETHAWDEDMQQLQNTSNFATSITPSL
jgi:hypothetical protein